LKTGPVSRAEKKFWTVFVESLLDLWKRTCGSVINFEKRTVRKIEQQYVSKRDYQYFTGNTNSLGKKPGDNITLPLIKWFRAKTLKIKHYCVKMSKHPN